MDWTKLDIRKASVLKKEVDMGLLRLSQYVQDGERQRKTELLESFTKRINEIEEFRSQNDSDERAMLFEKERLRLRKAVQDAGGSSSNSTTISPFSSSRQTPSVSPATVPPNSVFSDSMLMLGGGGGGGGRGGGGGGGGSSNTGSAKKTVASVKTFDASGIASPAPAKTSKTPSKIYMWEHDPEMTALKRERIAIDGLEFSPCAEVGMYARTVDGDSSTAVSVPEKYMDLQIILTEEEISVLARKFQHLKSIEKDSGSNFRNALSSGSVHHTAPYVDKKRIMKELYRPSQPDKWVAGGDMRV